MLPDAARVRLRQRAEDAVVALGRRPDLRALPSSHPSMADAVREAIAQVLNSDEEVRRLLSPAQREELCERWALDMTGYGPIHHLLADPEVEEVMINGPGVIYVERASAGMRLEPHPEAADQPLAFDDERHLLLILERLLRVTGRRVNEAEPLVDARLPDGSRLNAVLRPVARKGATITIRKFRPLLRADTLLHTGSLSPAAMAVLEAAIKARCNIVISGGTSSGKTTLLNILSASIPASERIVTVEDAAELDLLQPHVVSLETRQDNVEGEGAITIRDLVRNALRMRPDRIVVGEVRGAEALDMLQAMNTGHDGSLTTCHANSSQDALGRIHTMAAMSDEHLSDTAILKQIVSAVHLVVHSERMPDMSRRVVQITEVVGLQGDTIITHDLFRLQDRDGSWNLEAVATEPKRIGPLLAKRGQRIQLR